MRMYCIIDQSYVKKDCSCCSSCWDPNCSEDISFLELATPNSDLHWALYRCDIEDKENINNSIITVSDKLEELLFSAERFPPAIAIARNEISSLCSKKKLTKQEFLLEYEVCIKKHLQSQRSNKYIFTEAIKDELGYISKGSFYWLIGYDVKDNKVLWVSDDYFIYGNSADCFDISEDEIVELKTNLIA